MPALCHLPMCFSTTCKLPAYLYDLCLTASFLPCLPSPMHVCIVPCLLVVLCETRYESRHTHTHLRILHSKQEGEGGQAWVVVYACGCCLLPVHACMLFAAGALFFAGFCAFCTLQHTFALRCCMPAVLAWHAWHRLLFWCRTHFPPHTFSFAARILWDHNLSFSFFHLVFFSFVKTIIFLSFIAMRG